MSDAHLVPSPDSVPLAAPAPPAYGSVPLRRDEYDAVPPLSQGQRVLDTFFTPSRTFADIRRNRSWWLPFLLLAVFSLVFGVVAIKRVGIDTLLENAQRSNPAQAEKMQNMPPEQRATAARVGGAIMKTALYCGPVFLLLFAAIVALLLWVGCNFILGGSGTYPGMFAVSMYAMLPGLLAYLIIVITLFAGSPETFNINNPAGTNIGYYLPQDASAFFRSLLTSFDVIFLWEMVLLGLGAAIVARLKPAMGIALVLGGWFVIVLIKAGIAAATS